MYQAKSGVKNFSLYWDRVAPPRKSETWDPPKNLRPGTPPKNLRPGTPPWIDTHVWKHNLPSYVRTRAVIMEKLDCNFVSRNPRSTYCCHLNLTSLRRQKATFTVWLKQSQDTLNWNNHLDLSISSFYSKNWLEKQSKQKPTSLKRRFDRFLKNRIHFESCVLTFLF